MLANKKFNITRYGTTREFLPKPAETLHAQPPDLRGFLFRYDQSIEQTDLGKELVTSRCHSKTALNGVVTTYDFKIEHLTGFFLGLGTIQPKPTVDLKDFTQQISINQQSILIQGFSISEHNRALRSLSILSPEDPEREQKIREANECDYLDVTNNGIFISFSQSHLYAYSLRERIFKQIDRLTQHASEHAIDIQVDEKLLDQFNIALQEPISARRRFKNREQQDITGDYGVLIHRSQIYHIHENLLYYTPKLLAVLQQDLFLERVFITYLIHQLNTSPTFPETEIDRIGLLLDLQLYQSNPAIDNILAGISPFDRLFILRALNGIKHELDRSYSELLSFKRYLRNKTNDLITYAMERANDEQRIVTKIYRTLAQREDPMNINRITNKPIDQREESAVFFFLAQIFEIRNTLGGNESPSWIEFLIDADVHDYIRNLPYERIMLPSIELHVAIERYQSSSSQEQYNICHIATELRSFLDNSNDADSHPLTRINSASTSSELSDEEWQNKKDLLAWSSSVKYRYLQFVEAILLNQRNITGIKLLCYLVRWIILSFVDRINLQLLAENHPSLRSVVNAIRHYAFSFSLEHEHLSDDMKLYHQMNYPVINDDENQDSKAFIETKCLQNCISSLFIENESSFKLVADYCWIAPDKSTAYVILAYLLRKNPEKFTDLTDALLPYCRYGLFSESMLESIDAFSGELHSRMPAHSESYQQGISTLLKVIAYQPRQLNWSRQKFSHRHQIKTILLMRDITQQLQPENTSSASLSIESIDYATILNNFRDAHLNVEERLALTTVKFLPFAVDIFLRLYSIRITSFPVICGVTVAHFVLLLHHLKTIMPKKPSKPIREAFEEYQINVLDQWFSPPIQSNTLRKETDYFDSFLIESKQELFPEQQQAILAVKLSFCQILLEVLENNRIPEPYDSPTLKHYYQIVRSYAKNNTELSQRINNLIQSNFANLVLFYQAREAGEWLKNASIESIEQLLSTKGGDRYFIRLLFSWLQRDVILSYSYNLSALNQENSEKLSEYEIQPIYLYLKQNLDHSTIKNKRIFYSKLKEILEGLTLFRNCHDLRAMGAILSEQKDSKKYIDNNQKETLPAHFLLMKKENIFKTTEEYIINCLNYLLLCPLENSSDRQLAASILYPPHDRNEFYFTTQDNQRYHRIPAWMMIQHINMIGIQYFITDLILSIWKNIDTASSAEFRFLMRVIIGHEKQEKNLFIQALHNINDFHGILTSFTDKLQAKIDHKKQEIKQYAEYIFYAAVRFKNDPPNALDTAKEIAKNCLQHVTTIMQHRATNDSLLSSSMQYFLKSIEANNKKSYFGESPTLISAIGSLNTKQKEKFDQLVGKIPANQNYPCVLKTRTKVLALVRDSISFLKENSVTQINDPGNQLRVKDKVLDSDDQTLLRDTLLSVNIDAISFFTHYLSGNDISEPDPLLDTLAFFTMMQAFRIMLVYDDTNLNTPINSSQQPVSDLVSQVNDLHALTTASQTLFAALGITPTQPRIPESTRY